MYSRKPFKYNRRVGEMTRMSNTSKRFYCPIVNKEITEQQCVSFHGGGALPNGQTAEDFEPEELPCLQCEGLVRPAQPSSEYLKVMMMLGENHRFHPFLYQNFFVFAHNHSYLTEKTSAMLDMFDLAEDQKWLVMGQMHDQQGKKELAKLAYKYADQAKPTSDSVLKIAESMLEEKPHEALELLKKGSAMNAHGYYLLGRCSEKLTLWDQAEKYYKKALQMEKDYRVAHQRLAYLYYKEYLFDPEKSKYHFDQFLPSQWKLKKKNIKNFNGSYIFEEGDFNFLRYATLLYKLEQYEDAVAYVKRFLAYTNIETMADLRLKYKEERYVPFEEENELGYEERVYLYLQQLFGQAHLLVAKCHFHLEFEEDAKRHLRYAHGFLAKNEEIAEWSKRIEETIDEKQADDLIRLLRMKGFDMAQIVNTVDNLEDEHAMLKIIMEEKFRYYGERIEELQKRYGDIRDGEKFLKNEINKATYEALIQLDTLSKELIENSQDKRNYPKMSNVLELISTSEWLYMHFKPAFEKKKHSEEEIGFDSTFVVLSYFKALELFLAKKLSISSHGVPALYHDFSEDKLTAMRNNVRVGDSRFYRKTFSAYYTFIEFYHPKEKRLPEKYRADKAPLKPEFINEGRQLKEKIKGFVDRHRNKYLHKSAMPVQDVKKVREDFHALIEELTEKMI